MEGVVEANSTGAKGGGDDRSSRIERRGGYEDTGWR